MRASVNEIPPHDFPFWQTVLFAFGCGLAGEMFRADQQGLPAKQIFHRALLRSGASIAGGICTLLLCLHFNIDVYLSGAITGAASLAGAEVVIALYLAWLKRKVGAQS